MSAAVLDAPNLDGGARTLERRTPWTGAIMLITAILTPVMAYASQEGFVPLIALAGALMAWPTLFRTRAPSIGMGLLLLFTAWALVTLNWSVGAPRNPDFHKYIQLQTFTGLKLGFEAALYGLLIAGAATVSEPAARRAMLVLSVLLAAMAMLVMLEGFSQAAFFQWLERTFDKPMRADWAARNVARATYFIAVLIWPTAHLLTLRPKLAPLIWVTAVCGAIAALAFNVDAPLAALAISLLVYLFVRAGGRGMLWLLLVMGALYLLIAPWVVNLVRTGPLAIVAQHAKASWLMRLKIWTFTDGLILQNPWRGSGIQASRAYQPVIPMHPHSTALQIWLELGALGAGLAAAFWVWLILKIGGDTVDDRNMAAAEAASAAAYLVIGALSFGAWDEWWLALAGLAIAVCILVRRVRRTEMKAVISDDELLPTLP